MEQQEPGATGPEGRARPGALDAKAGRIRLWFPSEANHNVDQDGTVQIGSRQSQWAQAKIDWLGIHAQGYTDQQITDSTASLAQRVACRCPMVAVSPPEAGCLAAGEGIALVLRGQVPTRQNLLKHLGPISWDRVDAKAWQALTEVIRLWCAKHQVPRWDDWSQALQGLSTAAVPDPEEGDPKDRMQTRARRTEHGEGQGIGHGQERQSGVQAAGQAQQGSGPVTPQQQLTVGPDSGGPGMVSGSPQGTLSVQHVGLQLFGDSPGGDAVAAQQHVAHGHAQRTAEAARAVAEAQETVRQLQAQQLHLEHQAQEQMQHIATHKAALEQRVQTEAAEAQSQLRQKRDQQEAEASLQQRQVEQQIQKAREEAQAQLAYQQQVKNEWAERAARMRLEADEYQRQGEEAVCARQQVVEQAESRLTAQAQRLNALRTELRQAEAVQMEMEQRGVGLARAMAEAEERNARPSDRARKTRDGGGLAAPGSDGGRPESRNRTQRLRTVARDTRSPHRPGRRDCGTGGLNPVGTTGTRDPVPQRNAGVAGSGVPNARLGPTIGRYPGPARCEVDYGGVAGQLHARGDRGAPTAGQRAATDEEAPAFPLRGCVAQTGGISARSPRQRPGQRAGRYSVTEQSTCHTDRGGRCECMDRRGCETPVATESDHGPGRCGWRGGRDPQGEASEGSSASKRRRQGEFSDGADQRKSDQQRPFQFRRRGSRIGRIGHHGADARQVEEADHQGNGQRRHMDGPGEGSLGARRRGGLQQRKRRDQFTEASRNLDSRHTRCGRARCGAQAIGRSGRTRTTTRELKRPRNGPKQQRRPSRMTSRSGSESARSDGGLVRAPRSVRIQVRVSELIGRDVAVSVGEAARTLQMLMRNVSESNECAVGVGREGVRQRSREGEDGGSQSFSPVSNAAYDGRCGLRKRWQEGSAARALQSVWGSPGLLRQYESVCLQPCGRYRSGPPGLPPVWTRVRCGCQAVVRSETRSMELMVSDFEGVLRVLGPQNMLVTKVVQLVVRIEAAARGQAWRIASLHDVDKVLVRVIRTVAEAWWRKDQGMRERRRRIQSIWRLADVRAIMHDLNAVRCWVQALGVTVSAQEQSWTVWPRRVSLRTLRLWSLSAKVCQADGTSRRAQTVLQLIPPYEASRDQASGRAWVYALQGRAEADFYIGCTARTHGKARPPKGQLPHLRWLEHVQHGVRAMDMAVKATLPMYRRMRLRDEGIAGLVWQPLFALCDAPLQVLATRTGSDPREGVPTGSAVRSVRAVELVLQMWERPGLCTPYVWNHGVTVRRRQGFGDHVPRRQESQQDHEQSGPSTSIRSPTDITTWLVDEVTGAPWRPGRAWTAQYQQGRLVLSGHCLSDAECSGLLMRLVNHPGKQSAMTYPILRRMSPEQVTQLLRFTYRLSKAWESRVWSHIQRASKGRFTRVRVRRLRLQDRRTRDLSVHRAIAPVVAAVVRQVPQCLVRFAAPRGRNLGRVLLNETRWQRVFAAGTPPRCACQVLYEVVGPRSDRIHWVQQDGEAHAWCVWSELFAGDDFPEDEASPLGKTRNLLRSLKGGLDGRAGYPLHAKTILGESDGSVTSATGRALERLLPQVPEMTCLARRVGTSAWQQVVNLLARWCVDCPARVERPGREGEQGGDSSGPQGKLTVQWICRTWQLLRELVVGTVDKRPSDLRICCPCLAYREVKGEVARYFAPVADATDNDGAVSLLEWYKSVLRLRDQWFASEVSVPTGHALVCRCLAKAKDPGNKRRLVVTYDGVPSRDLMCVSARAADGLAGQVAARLEMVDESVASGTQVAQAFGRCQTALDNRTCPWVFVCKFDFVNFFMSVKREAAWRAVSWWVSKAGQAFPGKKYLRVRKDRWRTIEKELQGSSQPGVVDVQLARTPHADAEWDVVAIAGLRTILETDSQGLLQFDGRLWTQREGLTIGSPWGGTACRLWAVFNEYRMRAVRRWSLRDPSRRRGVGTGTLGGFRWVDDRYRIMRVVDQAMARCVYAVDVGTYAGAMWHHVMALGRTMQRHWQGSMSGLVDVVQRICACLVDGIGQTQESTTTVVGYDVSFAVFSDASGAPMICAGDLFEGMYVGRSEVVLQARLSTKSGGLLRSDPIHTLVHPRFTHSAVDVRARPERVSALVQWVARVADQAWYGGLLEGPHDDVPDAWIPVPQPGVGEHTVSVGRLHGPKDCSRSETHAGIFSAWQSQPVRGMMRELQCAGWTRSDLLTAVRRLEASTRCRTPTSALARRLRVVAWISRVVRTQWETVQCASGGHESGGLPPGEREGVWRVDVVPGGLGASAEEEDPAGVGSGHGATPE